ncbi:MAG: hypothetical protein ACTSRW_10470 [Candidatus Helarchaeota archaeon]
MFHTIYLINEAGICIYERHYVENKLDPDLVTGFMNAVGSFAKEAFLSGLQSMELEDNKRLIYGIDSKNRLLAAALADQVDHPKLQERILQQVIEAFLHDYEQTLNDVVKPKVYEGFTEKLDKIIKRRVRKRGKLQFGLACGLSLLCVFLLGVFMSPLLDVLNNTPYSILAIFIFIPPPLVSGLVAGNRKNGIIASTITLIPLIPLLLTSEPRYLGLLFITFVIMLLMIGSLYVTLGMLTGFLIERFYLYPKPANLEKKAEKHQKIKSA